MAGLRISITYVHSPTLTRLLVRTNKEDETICNCNAPPTQQDHQIGHLAISVIIMRERELTDFAQHTMHTRHYPRSEKGEHTLEEIKTTCFYFTGFVSLEGKEGGIAYISAGGCGEALTYIHSFGHNNNNDDDDDNCAYATDSFLRPSVRYISNLVRNSTRQQKQQPNCCTYDGEKACTSSSFSFLSLLSCRKRNEIVSVIKQQCG